MEQLSAQNLIPNPGFEIYDTCPNTTSQVKYCIEWKRVENSPDYFNSCAPGNTSSVPNNYFGYQPAHSGCAYVGAYTYDGTDLNYREFIQTKLTSTLLSGTQYFISFYINLMNGFGWSSGTNKMGCKLTTYEYSTFPVDSNPSPDNSATFYTDSIVIDTVGWVKISGSFIADSAYTYITFGNFFVDSSTQYINLVGFNIYSYYYIDDVCLSSDSTDCISVTASCSPAVVEQITAPMYEVYPTLMYNFLSAKAPPYDEILIQLFDTHGRMILNRLFKGKIELDVSLLTSGVYAYRLISKNKPVLSGKVVKE